MSFEIRVHGIAVGHLFAPRLPELFAKTNILCEDKYNRQQNHHRIGHYAAKGCQCAAGKRHRHTGIKTTLPLLWVDIDTARAMISPRLTRWGLATGVLLYSLVGVVAMWKGGNFLNYSVLADDMISGQHIGILLVELGVGITVAGAMVSIFFAFARQER